MGRKSRMKRERRIQPQQPQFHIAIGAAPVTYFDYNDTSKSKISLEHEVRLIKTALLYADKVTLYSMATSILASMLAMGQFNSKQKLEFIVGIAPYLANQVNIEGLAKNLPALVFMMENKALLPPEQLQYILNLEAQFENLWEGFNAQIEQFALEAGAGEIEQAVQTGLLEIKVLGQSQSTEFSHIRMDSITKGKAPDKILVEFLNHISRIVIYSEAYPLFDDMTGNFIQTLVQEDRIKVSETTISRGKHSLLAGRLLERLPLFDEATIDEIVDIRKELDKPLIRFRQAITSFSDNMKSASWDRDFAKEADQVFHQRVAPAILEIEEQVKQSKSLTQFGGKLLRKPLISGGSLSVVLSQALAFPELASSVLAASGLISAGVTTILEYQELLNERQKIAQNQLYFYYKAGRLLTKE